MKNNLVKSLVFAFASIGLLACDALALPVLTLDDGSTSIVISDNSSYDSASTIDGIIQYSGSVGGWDVTMSMGSSYPAIGELGFPAMHLTGATTSLSSTGTLGFTFTDTFSAWDSTLDGLISAFGGFGSGDVTFTTYLDGVELADFGPVTGAFSESFTSMITPADPTNFTLSIVGTITHDSIGQSSSFDGGIAPVPEPATMLLFGTGLASLAGVVRRKKK